VLGRVVTMPGGRPIKAQAIEAGRGATLASEALMALCKTSPANIRAD
jgi:hypothetical protein